MTCGRLFAAAHHGPYSPTMAPQQHERLFERLRRARTIIALGTLLVSLSARAGEPCQGLDACLARLEERCTQVARPFDDVEVRAIGRALALIGAPAVEPLRSRLRSGRP